MHQADTSFGFVLRRLRKEAQLTQQDLADLSSVRRETVYRLERSRRAPFEDSVRRLARGLGVVPEALDPNIRNGTLDPSDDQENFTPGEALRELRLACGKNLAQAARVAGVSTATLSRFERNARPTFSLCGRTSTWDDNPRGLKIVSQQLARLLGFDDADKLSAACGLPIKPRLLPFGHPDRLPDEDWYEMDWANGRIPYSER